MDINWNDTNDTADAHFDLTAIFAPTTTGATVQQLAALDIFISTTDDSVLTIVTVAISYLRLPTAYAIGIAMVVATVKASLVALYFMHLISEEKVILWLLALCAAFFVFLMLLPVGVTEGIAPLWPL